MADVTLTLATGRSLVFDIPEDGQGPACFLLSMRKCGSTLANHICALMAGANRRHFVNFGDAMFQNNILARDWQQDAALAQILRAGVIYGGFRDAPVGIFENEVFLQGRKVIVIRDPRDALVSEYFSNAFSHPVPEDPQGTDEMKNHLLRIRAQARTRTLEQGTVMGARSLTHSMMLLKPVLSMPNVVLVKYEDIVFEKARLVRTLASQFALPADAAQTQNILSQTDKFPDEENPQAFVRQVRPGDHRRKLTPDVIAKLNALLAEPMALFGYEATAPDA